MAEIDFSIYKTKPFYLHHNFEDFHHVYIENAPTILKMGENFLRESINIQEKREKDLYDLLGIQNNDWTQIATKIYGVFDINENNEQKIENKLELFLKNFTKFINEIFNESPVKFNKNYSIENAMQDYEKGKKDKKELINMINNFIKVYNNPIDTFLNWYETSELSEGKINKEEIQFLEELFKKSRKNRKQELKVSGDEDDKLKNMTEESLDEAINLLFSASGIISNMIGDIGEQATISFIQNGKKYITEAVGTSILTPETEEVIKKQNIIQGNINFYEKEQERINSQLKESGIKLSSKTKDGLLEFGCTYTGINTGTLSKNLKADEIFTFQFNLDTNDLRKYGISSKTSWSETADTIKLYSGSFYSALENMFKSNLTGAGDIGTIVNFLIYSIFNALGSGMYGSYNENNEKIKKIGNRYIFSGIEDFYTTKTIIDTKTKLPKRDKSGGIKIKTGQSSFFKEEIRPLYNLIIQDFAYQWFTGGISEQTHADFFSIYENNKHYFIPMSIILKAILNIGMNENNYLLKQNLLGDYKPTNNPLKIKDYLDTWEYGAMEELGSNLPFGSGKTITLSKEQLRGLL